MWSVTETLSFRPLPLHDYSPPPHLHYFNSHQAVLPQAVAPAVAVRRAMNIVLVMSHLNGAQYCLLTVNAIYPTSFMHMRKNFCLALLHYRLSCLASVQTLPLSEYSPTDSCSPPPLIGISPFSQFLTRLSYFLLSSSCHCLDWVSIPRCGLPPNSGLIHIIFFVNFFVTTHYVLFTSNTKVYMVYFSCGVFINKKFERIFSTSN